MPLTKRRKTTKMATRTLVALCTIFYVPRVRAKARIDTARKKIRADLRLWTRTPHFRPSHDCKCENKNFGYFFSSHTNRKRAPATRRHTRSCCSFNAADKRRRKKQLDIKRPPQEKRASVFYLRVRLNSSVQRLPSSSSSRSKLLLAAARARARSRFCRLPS